MKELIVYSSRYMCLYIYLKDRGSDNEGTSLNLF